MSLLQAKFLSKVEITFVGRFPGYTNVEVSAFSPFGTPWNVLFGGGLDIWI